MYELGRNHPVDAPAFDPVPHVAAFRPAFVDNDRKLLTVAHCSDSEVEGIIVWRDANTGQQVRAEPFVSHDSSTICSFAVSPDGQTLAECGFRSIRLRRIPGGEVIGSLDGHKNWVLDSAWAPDGGGFLTASMDRSARVWSLRMGKPLAAVPHQDEVVRVAFSPDGQSFATAQADGLVRLWRMPEPSKKYHIHLGPPNDFRAVMSRDGRLVMPTGWSLNRGQSSTRVYTVANGSPAGPSLSAPGLINGGDFSPDGSFVVLASSLPENVDQRGWREIRWAQQPGCITFWDWRSGKQLFAPLRTRTEPVDAAYSPDGTVVVVVCAGGDILIVDRQGSVVRQCRIHGRSVQPGLNPKRCVRFAPDGRVFVTLGLGPICAWETATLRARYTIGHADALLDAEFSRDGKWLAAASIDKAAEVWDAGTGERAGPPLRHPGWVFTAEFSPDGEQLLTSCRDKMARLWNWRTGELACAAIEHEDEVFDARFSADGRWLLTTDRYGTLRMWDRIFGESVAPSQRLSGTTGRTLIVVPDGKSVLVAGEMCGLDAFDLSHLTNLDSAYGLNITAQD
jgi:WD40 repeat protein